MAAAPSSLESAGMWKAWIVLCIAEARRMGLTPVETSKLHVILYLANTLADLFDVADPLPGPGDDLFEVNLIPTRIYICVGLQR
mgnify:CR=1 FL=1